MCFFPRQTCGLYQTAPSFVSESNTWLQKFRLHYAKRKTQLNKSWNTSKSLYPSGPSPAFLCPSVPTFCFYLHTCPPGGSICFTSIFYSELLILLKVTKDLPVSKWNGISHLHHQPCLLETFLPIMTFSDSSELPSPFIKPCSLHICWGPGTS